MAEVGQRGRRSTLTPSMALSDGTSPPRKKRLTLDDRPQHDSLLLLLLPCTRGGWNRSLSATSPTSGTEVTSTLARRRAGNLGTSPKEAAFNSNYFFPKKNVPQDERESQLGQQHVLRVRRVRLERAPHAQRPLPAWFHPTGLDSWLAVRLFSLPPL